MVAALPIMLRRRLSPLDQALVMGSLNCGTAVSDARIILATRHGELQRTANILAAQSAGETPSPADFALSVHHSLIGLLSIHTGNRKGHTAISAGQKSLRYGLLEAAACLAVNPDEDVLFLFSEPYPAAPYNELLPDQDADDFALVLLLSNQAGIALEDGMTLQSNLEGREFLRALLTAEARHAND